MVSIFYHFHLYLVIQGAGYIGPIDWAMLIGDKQLHSEAPTTL